MAQVTDSRVQFFNSQSSFGSSSSISYSRIQFINDQLITDTEEIFVTLKQILIPRQDLIDHIQINHIIHRARILAKQTIPQHILRLKKNNKQKQKQLCDIGNKCQQKLYRLVNDYQLYTNGKLTYQELYDLYGRQSKMKVKGININNKDFTKKKQIGGNYQYCNNIQPDVVNIIESAPVKTLQYMPRNSSLQSQRYYQQQKQLKKLQDQLQIYKKRQKNIIQNYQNSQKILRKQTNQRIYRILQIYQHNNNSNSNNSNNNGNSTQIIDKLKYQIQKLNTQLSNQIKNNDKLKQQIQTLNKQIQGLQNKNRILQDQINSNVNGNNNGNKIGNSHISQDRKSHYSQDNKAQDSNGNGNNNNKKLQKIIKNLQYQTTLLKNQLKKQRDLIYRNKKIQQNTKQNQLKNIQKTLQQTRNQLKQSYIQLDRYKVQNIRLIDQLQKSQKYTQLVKLQATNINIPYLSTNYTNKNNYVSNSNSTGNNFYKQNNKDKDKDMNININKLDQSRTTKYSIGTYIGDGNQNYPYYQFLNKQFKIRFRRSCLKDKQLLYKANGIQIGIISQYLYPNQIKINLHISNFCEQQIIKNLQLKLINSKNNKIAIKNTQYQLLQIGKQIKTIINTQIKYYPMGCTVLLCQYDYYQKHQQIRILLPIHIFKMLIFKSRDDNFRSSNKIIIQLQRKIAKDAISLCNYFKGIKLQNNVIKLTIYHQQTQTKLLCDLICKGNQVVLEYQHRSGDQNLSQYIVKTLGFLLKKQENI